MKRIISLLLFLSLSLLSLNLYAQVPLISEQEVLSELAKRGLDENEVREALLEKGIDLEKLDDINPEDIPIIEETILELEEEKKDEIEAEKYKNEKERLEQEKEDDEAKEKLEPEDSDTLVIDEKLEIKEVEIYGQEIFRNKVISVFTQHDIIKAPENYVLGAGDELAISVWGRSQFDKLFVINNDGSIKILNGSQRVFLKGLTLAAAREKLRKNYSNSYKFSEGEFDVSLSYSRNVKVNVYGEVINAGPVTVPAINTVFSAIVAAQGPNAIGSVRNIQLIRSDNKVQIMDVYAYMNKPQSNADFFLQDNDVILVPVADIIVNVEGAVRRPMKYELIEKEGIKELIGYAGGFADDAYKKNIRVKRYENDRLEILDIDWTKISNNSSNFLLQKGDVIQVDTISLEQRNYVMVEGQVASEGEYQRYNNMNVKDLIDRVGLMPESRTDVAFIKRTNPDNTISYIKLNLDNVLRNANDKDNIILQDKDVLTIWDRKRFADESKFAIEGAIRYPGEFPFDVSQNIQVRDAIMLAGGLRRDASDIAVIHRKDPLNPKIKEYITLNNLGDIIENPSISENYVLNAFDSLVIYSKEVFDEESFVRIEGAVNNAGLFQYGKGMTLKDLLTLAGGFKLAAATDNIEISRVEFQNNEPTKVNISNLSINRNIVNSQNDDGDYQLEPFDNVSIRFVPEFELQQNVVIQGEVKFPGQYTIKSENETISEIIGRAGGLTKEGFPGGATLIRSEQDYGAVVIKLDEILKTRNSEFNFTVRDGDTIAVPKLREFVTIMGATRASEVLNEDAINDGNVIHVPFHRGKDAMYYINQYAGGLSDDADFKSIFIEHPNGEINKSRTGFLAMKRPAVRKGSVIRVGYKFKADEEEEKPKDTDWTEILGNSVAQITSILTLLLLARQIN